MISIEDIVVELLSVICHNFSQREDELTGVFHNQQVSSLTHLAPFTNMV